MPVLLCLFFLESGERELVFMYQFVLSCSIQKLERFCSNPREAMMAGRFPVKFGQSLCQPFVGTCQGCHKEDVEVLRGTRTSKRSAWCAACWQPWLQHFREDELNGGNPGFDDRKDFKNPCKVQKLECSEVGSFFADKMFH